MKPYVRDYFISKYGNPIFASKTNIIGLLIEPYLYKSPLKPVFPDFDSFAEVQLTWTAQKEGYKDARVHNYINPDQYHSLSKSFEKIFWAIFFAHMDGASYDIKGLTMKEMIENFLQKYNIDPMTGSFDMFSKRYYRYLKSFGHLSKKNKAS